MKKLFNYRPNGHEITTENGVKKIMVIRKGVRGIIAMVRASGPVILWDSELADEHENDSEEVLIQRTIDVLND